MGRSDANPVFDHVALKTKELGIESAKRIEVLVTLIEGLQDLDWDTEDESLADFIDDPDVVEAFRRQDILVESWMTDEDNSDDPNGEDPHYPGQGAP